MRHHADISSLLEGERTLIICCLESFFPIEKGMEDQVFIYSCLGTVLQDEDEALRMNIDYFIRQKGCTQIILAGHWPCKAIDYIRNSGDDDLRLISLKEQIFTLLNENLIRLLNKKVHARALVCELVIKQAKSLMASGFIRKDVEQGLLTIKGIVSGPESTDVVFNNGLVVNTPIMMS